MEKLTHSGHPDPRPSEGSGEGRTGLLLVDKPAGITSHDVVALVRRAVHTRKVGHTGTLDPFATGLMLVLIGRGTRLIPYVEAEPKVYEATIRFGAETDTDDATGTVVREAGAAGPPDDAAIGDGIARLTGEIDQLPPAYSAKKVDGRRAYEAARHGEPLDLQPSRVTVHEWVVLDRSANDLRVRITCGTGTYIRALARDLGRFTGGAAHLSALRRTHSGPFSVAGAATVEQLKAGDFTLAPLRSAIPSLPVLRLDAAQLGRVSHGNAIDAGGMDGGLAGAARVALVALVDDEETLIAVADREGDELRPKLVLRDG